MHAEFPYRSALVTGATGHVGNNLVRALVERNVTVTALLHTREHETPLEGLSIRRVRGDVLEPESLTPAFEGAEIVFHCAGIVTILSRPTPELFRVNVDGVRNVVRAAGQAGVKRLVHFSSIHAFSTHPMDECVDETRHGCDEDPGYTPPYDLSKARGERAALEAIGVGIETVIVNPVSILGPCDFLLSPMGRLLLDLHARKLPALVSGSFDWVDVRDVAAGALAAAALGRSGERYLLTGTRLTVREFAERAALASGVPAPRLTLPVSCAYLALPLTALIAFLTDKAPLLTRPSLQTLHHHKAISSEKARGELGYSPRPIDVTIRDTYDWFRAQGKLS